MEQKREVLLKSLFGSHNYNLATETSDRDYRVFVLPNFDDIYYNRKLYSETIGEKEDEFIYDVRKLSELLFKSNPTFLEVLASKEMTVGEDCDEISKIIKMRDDIFKMNLPQFFKTCKGTHLNKMTRLEKGTQSTKHLIEKFGYDCYSDDTEFLTLNGWKKYDEITEVDLLGTINNDNHKVEFQKYNKRIKKEHKGIMYELENSYTNCLVTGNHRMLISNIFNRNKYGTKYNEEFSNWRYETMKNLLKDSRSFFHILTAPNPRIEECNSVSDSYLNLLGLYISDGTLNKKNSDKYKSIRITQTTNGKIEVFNIMDSLPTEFGFKRYDYDKETVWVSYNKEIVSKLYNECGHGEKNKRLPKWTLKLNKRQLDILINSLYLGDGTREIKDGKDYGIVYHTINKKLAGDIQAISLLSGRDSIVRGGISGYKSISNFDGKNLFMFQVYIKNNKSEPKSINIKKFTEKSAGYTKGIKEYEYEGNVVCFSVQNENLITRRKGKVAIQGNCKEALHAYRIAKIVERYADTNFNNFEHAIKFTDEDDIEFMLSIKDGFFKKENFENFIKHYYESTFIHYEELYLSQSVDYELKKEIDSLLFNLIKRKILKT